MIPKKEKRKLISVRLPEKILKEIDNIKRSENCNRTRIIEHYLSESLFSNREVSA